MAHEWDMLAEDMVLLSQLITDGMDRVLYTLVLQRLRSSGSIVLTALIHRFIS